MEEWKDIPGYEGRYQASTEGRIRSVAHTVTFVKHYAGKDVENTVEYPSKILTPTLTSGYYGVIFSIDGKTKYPLVHRLVALTFVDNPDNKPQVDHIDGDRLNNRATNLRWVTSKENHANAISQFKHVTQLAGKRRPVKDADTGMVFNSMLDAETYFNIPRGRISNAIKSGQRVYGHQFELVKEDT